MSDDKLQDGKRFCPHVNIEAAVNVHHISGGRKMEYRAVCRIHCKQCGRLFKFVAALPETPTTLHCVIEPSEESIPVQELFRGAAIGGGPIKILKG